MLVIDRIEEGIAVCEGGKGRVELPVQSLPDGAQEGVWQIDREETLRRRQQNHSRAAGLFARKPRQKSE